MCLRNKINLKYLIAYYLFLTDQLTVRVMPDELVVGNETIAMFTAMTTGISTNESNFIYQWKKRGSDTLPDKVSGVTGTVLTISNVLKSDEGQYYCIVTNEWDRSVESNNVTLTVYGM